MATVMAPRRRFGPLTRWFALGSLLVALAGWVGVVAVERGPAWREWWELRTAAGELRSPATAVAERATVTLGKAGAVALPWLIAAAAEPDPAIRYRAYQAIGFRSPAVGAVPTLMAGLDDPDQRIRDLAITSLRQVGPDAVGAVDQLIALLADADLDIRIQAAGALRQIQPATEPTRRPVLVAILVDPDPTRYPERRFLARLIQDWAPDARPAAVAGLLTLLGSPNPIPRRQAAESLGLFGPAPQAAIPALSRAIDNPDPVVRRRGKPARDRRFRPGPSPPGPAGSG